jgi:hypothetical protein
MPFANSGDVYATSLTLVPYPFGRAHGFVAMRRMIFAAWASSATPYLRARGGGWTVESEASRGNA